MNWDELSDIEKADEVAKRLRGPLKISGGAYTLVHAENELTPNDFVTLDKDGNAKKWIGIGTPHGLVTSTIKKGNYGWVQIKS